MITRFWVSVSLLLGSVHGHAVQEAAPRIQACGAFPVLHLRIAETEQLPAQHVALRACGPEEEWQLDADSPAPGVVLRLRTAKDLRTAQLEVAPPGKSPQRHSLDVDGAEQMLEKVADAPTLLVRLAPVPETPVFELRATNLGAAYVAVALASAAGWKLEGVEALGDAKITLQFQQIPVWAVLPLLADTAGMQVLRLGDKHARFGTSKDFDAMMALLQVTEFAERESALQRALVLAAPNDEHDLAVDPRDLLEELAGLAHGRGDHALAAKHFQRLLEESAKFSGKPEAHVDSSDHARWLTGLAESQLAAGNRAEARALLDRAQGIIEQRQGKHGADLPAVFNVKARLQDSDAVKVDLLNSAILNNEQNGGSISQRQVLRTQLCAVLQAQKRWPELEAVAGLLQAVEARRDFADQLIHSSALQWRARAQQGQGRLDEAVELWTELFFTVRDEEGAGADVLLELTQLELQRDRWLAASGWWSGVRALRNQLFGAKHPLTRAADLELLTLNVLERLNVGVPFSAELPAVGVHQLHAEALKAGTDLGRIELQHSLLPDLLAEVRKRLAAAGDDSTVEQRAKLLASQAELQLALIGQPERSGAAALYQQAVALQQDFAPHAVMTQILKQRLAELEGSR